MEMLRVPSVELPLTLCYRIYTVSIYAVHEFTEGPQWPLCSYLHGIPDKAKRAQHKRKETMTMNTHISRRYPAMDNHANYCQAQERIEKPRGHSFLANDMTMRHHFNDRTFPSSIKVILARIPHAARLVSTSPRWPPVLLQPQ